MDTAILSQMLMKEESVRLKPYRDTVGKLTIGVGRNLDDKGISMSEAMLMLANDVEGVQKELDAALPWWRSLDEVRQLVLADMCFNMGIAGLLTFKNTLAYIQSGNYEQAAKNMLLSKWHDQVGERADKLSQMMRTGVSA